MRDKRIKANIAYFKCFAITHLSTSMMLIPWNRVLIRSVVIVGPSVFSIMNRMVFAEMTKLTTYVASVEC